MGLFEKAKDAFSDSSTDDIWNVIKDSSELDDILEKSENRPQLIFKHSHRCSICFVARGNLENAAREILAYADMNFLNVVNSRDLSDRIASELDVRHESPQVILIEDGEVITHASHGDIKGDKILNIFKEEY